MKYNKEYILKKAFAIFMEKGYDRTSISILQEKLQMSRGAMYRHFENKEDLFKKVIDEYVLKLMYALFKRTDSKEKISVKRLIEEIYLRQRLLFSMYLKVGVNYHVFLNFTALIIQATKHYAGFSKKFNKIQRKFLALWKQTLRKSKDLGEISNNIEIDIIAQLFFSISFKDLSVEYPKRSMDNNLFMQVTEKNIETRRKMLNSLYTMIKT